MGGEKEVDKEKGGGKEREREGRVLSREYSTRFRI